MSILTNDVWALSEDDFPRADALENQLGFLLRYAILAPSTKNSQPWAFSIQGNRIHLIVDDIVAEVDRLRAAGVTFRNEIVRGPGGAQILIDDPSGNPIELFQPR